MKITDKILLALWAMTAGEADRKSAYMDLFAGYRAGTVQVAI